jgi:hypothetical protein
VWDTLKSWFFGYVEDIKQIWSGITGFFSGLWDAVKQGPAEAVAYIKDAFLGLFSSIQEKLFGFINKIKEGWDTVKSVFGGAVEGAVNFITGGGPSTAGGGARRVNDMILTPEGRLETSPDDYIMAMRDPASLVDSMLRFLGQGGQPQPAIAGFPGNSLLGSAMNQTAARQTTYQSSSSNYTENFTAPITVKINAGGMTPEQAQTAVQRAMQDALKGAINSSRGNIPAPEARRY